MAKTFTPSPTTIQRAAPLVMSQQGGWVPSSDPSAMNNPFQNFQGGGMQQAGNAGVYGGGVPYGPANGGPYVPANVNQNLNQALYGAPAMQFGGGGGWPGVMQGVGNAVAQMQMGGNAMGMQGGGGAGGAGGGGASNDPVQKMLAANPGMQPWIAQTYVQNGITPGPRGSGASDWQYWQTDAMQNSGGDIGYLQGRIVQALTGGGGGDGSSASQQPTPSGGPTGQMGTNLYGSMGAGPNVQAGTYAGGFGNSGYGRGMGGAPQGGAGLAQLLAMGEIGRAHV